MKDHSSLIVMAMRVSLVCCRAAVLGLVFSMQATRNDLGSSNDSTAPHPGHIIVGMESIARD